MAMPNCAPRRRQLRRPRRILPLDDLRPAVSGRDDQLRRPPGDRHPQADAAGASSAGAKSTTPTSSSRSSSPTRSGSCSPGRIMDRLGIKRGFALALVDLVARGHGGSRSRRASARGRGAASARSDWPTRRRSPASSSSRFVLGLGESGNFPAAIKTVAEWFPRARARVRDRDVQRRHQHRRGDHADDRAA